MAFVGCCCLGGGGVVEAFLCSIWYTVFEGFRV